MVDTSILDEWWFDALCIKVDGAPVNMKLNKQREEGRSLRLALSLNTVNRMHGEWERLRSRTKPPYQLNQQNWCEISKPHKNSKKNSKTLK